jgi:hypothetical protein
MRPSWPTPDLADAGRKVLAIGIPGGIVSGFTDVQAGEGLVRLGGNLMSLSPGEYQLWDASQLAPAIGPLLEQASHAGVAEPAQTLTELEAAGLVLTYGDEPGSVERVTTGLNARLTGRLIGNGPHASPRFLVSAHAAAAQLAVDALVYQFLLLADGRTSIADVCTRIDSGMPGPDVDAISHVASWIPRLLRAGLIVLDLADPANEAPR